MPKRWFPLESNPEVMSSYCANLGFDTSLFSFQDVYSTEDWALQMIARPVVGVLMLFPVKEVSEQHRTQEALNIEENGQIVSPNVYYMKQTVGNACGTVGMLHAIANARPYVNIIPDSYLDKFFITTATMAPIEIAQYLENDDEIEVAHESFASEGQSEQQAGEVDNHFICFSLVDGCLYELDGRKKFPINHGPSSNETLLEDACQVVKAFMDRDPGELRYTIIALAKNPDGFDEDD
eukprot:gene5186-7216_t